MGLVDSSGTLMISYIYEGYGECYSLSNTSDKAPLMSANNHLLYRGYVMDKGTGLYYLQSRYYDPNVGRFINADSLLNQESLMGYNMFAYCLNNPVSMSDTTGNIPFFAITAAIGAVVGAVVGGVIAAKSGGNIWAGVGIGAAAGALIGTGVGMAAGVALAGSIAASAGAVAAGASALMAAVSTGGVSAGVTYISNNIAKATTGTPPPTTPPKSTSSTNALSTNPLQGITYTEKVQTQMQQNDYHGFPKIVDNYGSYGIQTRFQGNDGHMYTKLEILGSYNGKDGKFVYIWDGLGQCNHRMFEELSKHG